MSDCYVDPHDRRLAALGRGLLEVADHTSIQRTRRTVS